ncbi:MAG: guanylate kinase [Proteobacteria bacterium]|nr:guanylate kinase [Pseudomonadota bacterium]
MAQAKKNQVPIHRKGFMVVLSSPSGAGKTTLSRMLLEQDKKLRMSISATTRAKRPGEKDAVDYYFVSKQKFAEMVTNGEFLECAEVFGNSYGTPEKPVFESLEKGTDVLFDIDWQGTQQLLARARLDVVTIFILPPTMQELERRLRGRAQDSEEVVKGRMAKASHEISHWYIYDYVIVNHDLDESLKHLLSIIDAERQKRDRQQGLAEFVGSLIG